MAAIDIGSGATDRASYWALSGWTTLDLANPANNTGAITSFELWFLSGYNGAGVKVGTFSGSGTSYDDRDYETIGTVTGGSKQTFTGLNCDVAVGDFIGFYETSGQIELDETGGSGVYKIYEDIFGQGVHTYAFTSGYVLSLYGTGTTGWAHISKVLGVASASISKVDGVAVANIAKIDGVAV
jgi:hypothetical protein